MSAAQGPEAAGAVRGPATGSAAGESVEDFRARLRGYLDSHSRVPAPRHADERFAWQKAWAARLFDDGYAGPAWPREYGGMALPFAKQVAYQEEMSCARVPAVPGTGTLIAAPAIIKYGTAEQKQRLLPPMLRADRVWAQGYSESEAGSDLAALRTRARLDGDSYLVSGHKLWTSQGHRADVLFTLVRTGTQASRQLGAFGLLGAGDPHAVQRGRWLKGFLSARAATIGAGTAEIQRNTVAEQVLGLPRDPAMPSAREGT
jgi:alkylation response protein AidB-like acyl-CoA dehydrogenase